MSIEFKNEVINLFKYADQLSGEYVQYHLCPDSSVLAKWSTDRICLYTNGPILGLLREQDSYLFNVLSVKPSDELSRDIVSLLNWMKEKCDEHAKKLVEPFERNEAQTILKKSSKKLQVSTENDILEWVKSNYAFLLSETRELSLDSKLVFLYIYFGYAYYCSEKDRRIEVEQTNIKNLYSDLEDRDFRKYELIPIDRVRELIVANPCRIYDEEIDRTLFLMVQPQVAAVLDELYANKRIEKLSFRGIDTQIYTGRCSMGYIMEEIEYGLQFKLNVKKLPRVTKLFSKTYNDQLWVSVSNDEMQFEELCDDFMIQDEAIVTQLVHLIYEVKGNAPVIKHIDHEYIFYSINEYANRLENPTVKGKKRKRIKTFKVDEASIDMSYMCNVFDVQDIRCVHKIKVPFLYFVLNAYFKHKDLLNEYFEELLKLDGDSYP